MNFEDAFDVVPPEGKILAFTLIAHLMKRDILRYDGWNIKGQRIMEKHGHSPISFSRH